jgi:tyrosyl-tRNA synthetase
MMHLGMGLLCGRKIIDLIDAGFDFTIFLADWHSWINNKLGGDMKKIRLVGEYFKHCFTSIGVNPNRVKYLWTSDITDEVDYWEKVIRIAKNTTLNRTRRTIPIMGRSTDSGDIETATLFYPCMQVADIYHLDVDVACAGIDQRKAHMLAREVSTKMNKKKPVSIHTHLLMGLEKPSIGGKEKYDENERLNLQIAVKMSKSKPSKCVFIHDSPEEIREKIKGAYCPQKVEDNPIIDVAEYIVFPAKGELTIERPSKYGGPLTLYNIAELKEAYSKGLIHPLDLKVNIAEAIIDVLSGVRDYFKQYENILMEVKGLTVTR